MSIARRRLDEDVFEREFAIESLKSDRQLGHTADLERVCRDQHSHRGNHYRFIFSWSAGESSQSKSIKSPSYESVVDRIYKI